MEPHSDARTSKDCISCPLVIAPSPSGVCLAADLGCGRLCWCARVLFCKVACARPCVRVLARVLICGARRPCTGTLRTCMTRPTKPPSSVGDDAVSCVHAHVPCRDQLFGSHSQGRRRAPTSSCPRWHCPAGCTPRTTRAFPEAVRRRSIAADRRPTRRATSSRRASCATPRSASRSRRTSARRRATTGPTPMPNCQARSAPAARPPLLSSGPRRHPTTSSTPACRLSS